MYVFKSVFMGVTAYLHASVSVYVFVCEFVYFFAWISINQETDILLGIVWFGDQFLEYLSYSDENAKFLRCIFL